MNKRLRGMAVFMIAAAVIAGVSATASGTLVDTAGHWAAPLLAALEAKGIVAGDAGGRFDPDAPLTRAQLAKVIVIGLGNDANARILSRYKSRFTDMPGWHWANGYVEALAEMAVTEGYPDGSFGPSDTVTRAQMAVFLVRVLGLSDEAWRMRLIPTTYADDQDIPDWARGSIHVALANGMMNGFAGGIFRPQQPVTKAEGGVALLRLLGRMGRAYNLTGTLVQFDPTTQKGVVRDQLGQETPFTMAPGSTYFRAGVTAQPELIRLVDQVWIVFDGDGHGWFMEARYPDLLGTRAVVDGSSLTITGPDGIQKTLALQPGALVYLNGRPATLPQLQGAPEVYLALDAETGEIRVADGVNPSVKGVVTSVDLTGQRIYADAGSGTKPYTVAKEALLVLNGQPIGFQDLHVGDRVQLAVDETGAVIYLQAER
ncbi:MAG TPA: S-layer homology domain-containing protein [Symbiobacteriaceae bacterium]|jgi:hypothetical protein